MKKAVALVFALSLLQTTTASARIRLDQWSEQDIKREVLYLSITAVDWAQTRYIVEHPEYYELNPLLGRHPGIGEVNRYFLASAAIHISVSGLLSPKKRRLYQTATIALEGCIVFNNDRIGIGLRW